jgi:putative AlgH/UPF0301 family transcriptional regulator
MKEQVRLKNYTGQLLIALPNTAHNEYSHGVMLVTSHWSRGYSSCMINRRLAPYQTVGNLMQTMGIHYPSRDPIFYGGPDDSQKVSFVHTLDWQCSSTKILTEELGMTHEYSILAALAAGGGPMNWRCVAGHRLVVNDPDLPESIHGEISGEPPWTPGHRWMTLPATPERVFTSFDDEQWLTSIDESAKLKVSSWFNHAQN